MSGYPSFGEDWRRRWLQQSKSPTLHRLAATDGEWDERRMPLSVVGATACGAQGRLVMPGIMSRLNDPRCPECCRLAGIPEGQGAPYNDEALSEVQREA